MSEIFPVAYLARHGETAWTLTGQHTGLTDLPLTERGESNARRLGLRLAGIPFARVFTSPLQRAIRTCELAGFAQAAELDHDLVEWNYGRYEGSSGHFLRVLATRWIEMPPIDGQALMLSTASLSSLSYENSLSRPAIALWNDTNHVRPSDGPQYSKPGEHERTTATI